jgi:hypothetical protein
MSLIPSASLTQTYADWIAGDTPDTTAKLTRTAVSDSGYNCTDSV